MAEVEELREEWESGGVGEWGRLEVCSKQQAV